MQNFFDVLSRCPLFSGMGEDEISSMLQCLGAREVRAEKGEPLFLEGDPADFVGVVLSGVIQIVRDDYYGGRSLIAVAEEGDLFAEVFSCAGEDRLPVSAFAIRDSEVLLLNCRRVLTVCSSACSFHSRLIENLLRVVAKKSLALSGKIRIMSHRTTREKIMAYLSEQAKEKGSDAFTIPFDRQGLADYLGVERSAMSTEISRLAREGCIETKGSFFRLTGEECRGDSV